MKAAERVEARQWAGGPSGGREVEKKGEEGGPRTRESKKRARCAIAGGKSLPPEGDASAG